MLARACHDRAQRLAYVIQLNEAIDDLKIQLQLAKALAVFRHFKAFETIARLAVAVGKQSGGVAATIDAKADSLNQCTCALGVLIHCAPVASAWRGWARNGLAANRRAGI